MTDFSFPSISAQTRLRSAPIFPAAVGDDDKPWSSAFEAVDTWSIRRLGIEDSVSLAKLRLSVVAEEPIHLGTSFEEELGRPLKSFWDLLSRPEPNVSFGAFVQSRLIGAAMLSWHGSSPLFRHKCELWGVLVSANHRRQGIARALVACAVRHAWSRKARRINLQVYSTDTRSTALYRSLGFVEYGCERDSLLLGERSVDSRLMSLVNDQPTA